MIIPLLLTAGVLGALYLTREPMAQAAPVPAGTGPMGPTPTQMALQQELAAVIQRYQANPASVTPAELDDLADRLQAANAPEHALVRSIAQALRAAPPIVVPPVVVPGAPAAMQGYPYYW
jgi:hypothetical protein